jgi:hypothetical protein
VEQDGCLGFHKRYLDRTEHRSVHASEREQMTSSASDGDIHRHIDAGRVRAGALHHR